MNAPLTPQDAQLDWAEANQQLLVAEFARLKQRLDNAAGESDTQAVERARAALPEPAAIDYLADCFDLSPFERELLLLCAGMEMDDALAQRCASAMGIPERSASITFGCALALLDAPHWTALTPVRPLRRWRLVELDETRGTSVTQSSIRIDERILHYLAGVNYLDSRLRSLLRPVALPAVMAGTHRAVCDAVLAAAAAADGSAAPVLWLTGDDLAGQTDVAAEIAASLGLALHALRAEDVPVGHAELDALATLWEREALLLGSALLVHAGEEALSRAVLSLIERLHGLVFVAARQPQPVSRPTLRFTVDKPGPAEQKSLWQAALGEHVRHVNGALDGIASQFKLSARAIQDQAEQLVPLLSASERPERAMWSACRTLCRSTLDELAQRIEPCASWDHLVLPDTQKAALRQISAQVRHRMTVHLDWGFAEQGARGLGISVLFAGESGTGKTMAAEVLAGELQLDLYRIDLSSIVSKYIGETEKNLRRVFDAAEDSGAVLLFDEADALFGKRSEVKDSHDRYANIEVSYLLQRMESYRGLAILTSNLKTALDTAFQRRLRFIVQFPFPDQAQREAIWRNAFPVRVPLDAIDYRKLASLNVAGGNIRNIALCAAFYAADRGNPVSMGDLLRAAHHEASKRERVLSDAETRGWV